MHCSLKANIRISLSTPITTLSVDEHIYALLGFNANDFISGKINLQNLIHQDDQDIAATLFSSELPTKTTTNSRSFNVRLRHADGQIRCIKGYYEKIVLDNVLVLDLLLQDAKSLWQPQSDQSLMANFKAMMDNTDDYIYFKDRNHVFTGASQALVKITESTQHWTEFLGLTDYDVFLEAYADIYYSLEKKVFSGVDVAHDIQETLLQDGSKGWINNRNYPINNENGEIVGLFGIARDITESKQAELALQVSEAYLKESQKIAGLGSYVFNIQDGTWQSSAILNQILGIDDSYERNEQSWDALIHPDDLVKAKHYLRRRFAAKSSTFDREYRVIRPNDHAERYIRGIGRLVLDKQGRPLQMHGTIQDITSVRHELLNEKRAILGNQLVGALALKQRKIIWANTAFETMLGYEPGELVGVPTRRFYTNEDEYKSVEIIYADIAKNNIGHTQHEYVRKDGRRIWLAMSGAQLNKDTDESLWTFVDITQQKLAESELRIAAVAFESQESMIITDANNVILRVNRAFTDTTGYTAANAIGNNPKMLNSGCHDPSFFADMWNTIQSIGTWNGEVWNRRRNGELYPEHLTITAVKNVAGEITNYVGTATDITTSKAAAAEIENLAFYDHLTGLPNRRLLVDRLNHALLYSARHDKDGAVLFLDLDHFKTINDTLGHDVGDVLLQQVATRLTNCMREGDTVARLGGDEFVVMIEGLDEQGAEAATQTEEVGEKILAALNLPYQLAGQEYQIGCSIGVALFSDHKQSLDDLLKHADIAMYQAKKSGRNALRFFDPKMQASINTRVALEADLRIALKEKQFKLYFQPQVYHNRQITGAEVLIRWEHPNRGMVSPYDFIPLAEETGLILPIGQWVLETACQQIKAWENNLLTQHLQLAVNVSARQFFQPDFVEQVLLAIHQTKINPDKLKLELTESLVLDDITDTIDKMHQLQKVGVRFSMDDFGTGQSSLAYLTQLPLDQLKIDQSFTRNIGVKRSDAVIVQTIIGMGNNLGMEIIAEGVETEAQREFLQAHGCPVFQGYLFSKPVPLETFEMMLK
ncbi:MAG: EAL domain-containing protein [Methylotenera sp.]|nr:EAL domain-containing protein [Methylotenera sp.]MDP2101756.1 EAL domain-containing protein [Methylotenera sp.]MDP2281977.1 EAL domain-containing protein [Methylotenera sp.]MDP3061013.1 EAL domain-containing protein [Methylotenera sp.]